MAKKRRVAIMLEIEWPYKHHASTFAGIQQYAQESGYWDCIVDEYCQYTIPRSKSTSPVYDGVIARVVRQLSTRATRANVPLVNVWFSSPVRDTPAVFPDFKKIGHIYFEHLLERGFQHFGCLLTDAARGQSLIAKTISDLAEQQGCICNAAYLDPTPERSRKLWLETIRIIENWIDKWKLPLGVYIGNEAVARQVVQICHSRNLKIPEQVAIVTGYNNELVCEYPQPSLTSIEVGFERIGYEAAKLLDRMMDGEAAPSEPIIIPPLSIIPRESTDFHAVNDEITQRALRYISENCHLSISTDQIAKAAYTTRRTLQNRFNKYLGRPVATEVRRLRLERAKRLLSQSDLPVYSIAAKSGFGDTKRMNQVFRRELNMTPGQYRTQNSNTTFE